MLILSSRTEPHTGKSTGACCGHTFGSACQITSRPSAPLKDVICAPLRRTFAVVFRYFSSNSVIKAPPFVASHILFSPGPAAYVRRGRPSFASIIAQKSFPVHRRRRKAKNLLCGAAPHAIITGAGKEPQDGGYEKAPGFGPKPPNGRKYPFAGTNAISAGTYSAPRPACSCRWRARKALCLRRS